MKDEDVPESWEDVFATAADIPTSVTFAVAPAAEGPAEEPVFFVEDDANVLVEVLVQVLASPWQGRRPELPSVADS